MMAVGSAIGWLSAMALSSDVMVCFHDGFSRQTTGLWAVGSIAAGVTAAALTTIWFGWKIARGARGPETRKRPAPPF